MGSSCILGAHEISRAACMQIDRGRDKARTHTSNVAATSCRPADSTMLTVAGNGIALLDLFTFLGDQHRLLRKGERSWERQATASKRWLHGGLLNALLGSPLTNHLQVSIGSLHSKLQVLQPRAYESDVLGGVPRRCGDRGHGRRETAMQCDSAIERRSLLWRSCCAVLQPEPAWRHGPFVVHCTLW